MNLYENTLCIACGKVIKILQSVNGDKYPRYDEILEAYTEFCDDVCEAEFLRFKKLISKEG